MALAPAMTSGIAGLKTHMDALTVVGNNIANVNTAGYKAARVTFQESIYSTSSASSDGTATLAGINAKQTGYGNTVATIDLNMGSQSVTPTGLATDCAIRGEGFFLVGTKDGVSADSIDTLNLSRLGNFTFDADGYLTTKDGNVVYGFATANAAFDATGNPISTTEPGINGNTVSTQLVPIRAPLRITEEFLTLNPAFATANPGVEPNDALYPGVDGGFNSYGTLDGIDELESIAFQDLQIDSAGRIVCTNAVTTEPVVVGYIALGTVANPSALMHTEGPYYKAMGNTGDILVSFAGGTPEGAPTSLNNGEEINGATIDLGGGASTLMTSFLEDSGTDLATEFSNMIIYQRGYQANTRIISVTDTMLEELVNIKR